MNKMTLCVLAVAAGFAAQGFAADERAKRNAGPAKARANTNAATPKPVSSGDLRQNVDLKGLADQNKGARGSENPKARMMGVGGEGNKTTGKERVLGESKAPGGAGAQLKDSIGNQGPITGSKYGDTFGGDRINSKQESGGTQNFKGGGKGNAGLEDGERSIIGVGPGIDSTGMNRKETADTISQQLRMEGGKPSGNTEKDIEALGRAQAIGGIDPKTGRPRDDDTGSSGNAPMGRQEILTNQRGIAGRTGGAGGKGDGRTDQLQTTGGSGGGVIARDKAEGAQREMGSGAINMDKALEINKEVNPTRQ